MSIDCSFSIISGIAVAELDCGKNGALDKQSHESDCSLQVWDCHCAEHLQSPENVL